MLDMPMKDIIDLMLQVNMGAYQFEAANPRHEHNGWSGDGQATGGKN